MGLQGPAGADSIVPGPSGPAGPVGPIGPSNGFVTSTSQVALAPNTFTIVAQLTVPAGSFMLRAKVIVSSGTPSYLPVTCQISNGFGGPVLDTGIVFIQYPYATTMSMQGFATFVQASNPVLQCIPGSGANGLTVSAIQLSAIQVGTLTQQ